MSEEIRRCAFPLRGISVNFACLSSEAPGQTHLARALDALDSIRPFCLPDADISAGGTDMLEFAEHDSLPADVREIRCGTGVTLGLYPLSGRAVPRPDRTPSGWKPRFWNAASRKAASWRLSIRELFTPRRNV